MNTIFVYGLLKPGQSLHHVVAPFILRSEPATTRGRLYDAGVPAGRFDEDGEVDGFVYWVDDDHVAAVLEILDDLEDEGEVYSRIEVDVATVEGSLRAHAYHYIGPLAGRPEVGRSWPI